MVIEVDSLPYHKMVLHCLKYPHCHIRGVLLGQTMDGGTKITDVIPAVHNSLVTPILETLFIHLDSYCKEEKLKILGVYFSNQNLNNRLVLKFIKQVFSFDDVWAKIALDKLNSPIILQVIFKLEIIF